MSEKVKVTRVEIQMGSDKKMLTIEQAQRLRDQLNDLFGAKVEEHHHHHHERITRPTFYNIDTTIDPIFTQCRSSSGPICHSKPTDEYTARLEC